MNAHDETRGPGAALAKIALAVLLLGIAILVVEFTGRQLEEGQSATVTVEENSLSSEN
jgi:hypothetical protein